MFFSKKIDTYHEQDEVMMLLFIVGRLDYNRGSETKIIYLAFQLLQMYNYKVKCVYYQELMRAEGPKERPTY